MIIYFSGTGNSRYCAQLLANKLGDKAVNAAEYIKNGNVPDLYSDKPWVFVSPIYGWRIPHIFSDFILDGKFKGNKNAYFVITCGSDIGSAEKYIEPLCHKKGFSLLGVLEVVMPENYIAMFPVPDEAESEKIISAAHQLLEKTANLMADGKQLSKRSCRLGDDLKSGIVNRVFFHCFVKATPFRTTDKCIGCGKCVSLCPLNNITLKDSKPVWGDNCTHCMACICHCPTEAIEYGRRSAGKRRYLCPEYEEAAR